MPSKLPWARLRGLVKEMGGPRAASGALVGAREGRGAVKALEGMDQPALAQADRYAQGAMARETLGPAAFLGLPAAALYEGAKAVEQSPASNWATRLMLDLSGGPINEKTSPASFANLSAYFGGMADKPEEQKPMGPPPVFTARR